MTTTVFSLLSVIVTFPGLVEPCLQNVHFMTLFPKSGYFLRQNVPVAVFIVSANILKEFDVYLMHVAGC
jgi:hypothetical protein